MCFLGGFGKAKGKQIVVWIDYYQSQSEKAGHVDLPGQLTIFAHRNGHIRIDGT